jgi:ATP-dependent RNA helicase RhlE
MSTNSFADLGVSGAVVEALSARGFDSPFAIQEKVIGDVLDGRDVLAKSPTGSGKTLAFMVPLVDSLASEAPRPAALVLAPTRELATQIVEASYPLAHARALKICAVYGGVGLQKQARDAAASHIIVATPGRLEDLLQRRAFSLKNVEILVLDEADRMLDMGFRPAVDRIVATCPRDRQTLFFSATLDGEAGRIAREYTTDAAIHEHVPPQRRAADIEHRFVRVESDGRLDALVDEIGHGHDLNLVFVRTKHGADRLVRHLKGRKVPAVAMHGNKSQNQRERALADFESGRVTTLVATDVAARGIHVDNVAKVINFDPPGLTEDYVHRTGRTGRAGETGEAVTFIGHDHVADMRKMAATLKLDEQFTKAAGAAPAPPARGSRNNGNGAGAGSGQSRRRRSRRPSGGRPSGSSAR